MILGTTDAETCKLNGWTVGDELRGQDGGGPAIRLTAIGQRIVLAAPAAGGEEFVCTLALNRWERVEAPSVAGGWLLVAIMQFWPRVEMRKGKNVGIVVIEPGKSVSVLVADAGNWLGYGDIDGARATIESAARRLREIAPNKAAIEDWCERETGQVRVLMPPILATPASDCEALFDYYVGGVPKRAFVKQVGG